jgi:FtsP/CotA-like multicopper oxidase with cupredoxin domain
MPCAHGPDSNKETISMSRLPRRETIEESKPPTLSRRFMIGLGAAAGGVAFSARGILAQDATPGTSHPHASPDASPAVSVNGTPVSIADATPVTARFEGVTGESLVQPDVRESIDGVLETRLEAKLSSTTVAGRDVTSTVYEGRFPGPTLSLFPGDTLRVKLVNSLDECTNIHTHGFHVSPRDNSDNIFLHIDPGTEFDYEYQIPDNHPSGLYWYHPHCHGLTAAQTTGGMSGAIIVRGGLDEIEGVAGLTDRLLVLQSTQFDGNGKMVPFEQQSPVSRMRLVNGQLQPTIAAQPGETQRWRVANVTSDDFFLLNLEGHTLHVIAKDGNPYDEVVPVNEILLAPAERVEFLVQVSSTAGSYQLRTLAWGEDYQQQPDVLLATLVAEGDVLEPAPLPTTLIPFEDLGTLPIDRQRVTTFEEPGAPLFLAIDGKHWDADRIDQTVQLGALEEWVVRNTSSHRHPFHIHVNDFQVVALNGQPVQAHGWQDTVNLPPGGEVTIRMRFADFTGKFVYHCHILSHEDFGMMANVEVVE